MKRAAGLFVAIATAAVAGSAAADGSRELARAREQLGQVDYEGAAGSLSAALQTGDNGKPELIEIYTLWGGVAAALGRDEEARDLFSRLLALDPDAKLPGKSPRITRHFDAARADLGGRGLAAHHEIASGGQRSVAVIIDEDPLSMIAGARARYRVDGGPEITASAERLERMEIPLPAAGRIEMTLSAVDRWGNRLVELGSKKEPIVIDAAGGPSVRPRLDVTGSGTPPAEREQPLYRRWYVWGGLATLAAGSGVLFTLRGRSNLDKIDELNAESGNHVFSETALEQEDHLRTNRLLSTISFAAAGGLAAAAITFAVLDREPSEPAISVAPSPGSAQVTVRVRF